MKTAVLLLLSAVAWGQIGLTMKAWEVQDAKDLLGLRKHLPWDLSVTCAPGVTSFRRQDVAALLDQSELSFTASIDVLEKAQRLDGRTLGGKALAVVIQATGAGLMGFGAATVNPWFVSGGLGLTFGDGIRDVLGSVEVQTARYTGHILPDNDKPVPCVDGRGGQWLLLTGPVKNPKRQVVALAATSPCWMWPDKTFCHQEPPPISLPTTAIPLNTTVKSNLAGIRTHPMVDDLDIFSPPLKRTEVSINPALIDEQFDWLHDGLVSRWSHEGMARTGVPE
jgi:hypothetical protein